MSMRSEVTQVFVEDLRIESFVGLHAPERDQSQTIAIDIKATLRSPEVLNDDLANTFDYVPIVEKIRKLASSKRRKLIETLAEEVAGACFENPHIESVIVSVRKPNKFPDLKAVGTTRTFRKEPAGAQ